MFEIPGVEIVFIHAVLSSLIVFLSFREKNRVISPCPKGRKSGRSCDVYNLPCQRRSLFIILYT